MKMSGALSVGVATAALAGLALLVFGIVWMTAVFPRYEQIPGDWERIDDFQGTFTVTDQAFLARLQGNAVVEGLMSAGGAQLLADPALAGLLGNTEVLGLLQDPAVLTALATPAGLQQLAAHPVAGPLLADPAVTAVLANPIVQMVLSDAEVISLLLDPRTQAILANPADLPMLEVPVTLHRERRATDIDGGLVFVKETAEYSRTDTGGPVPGFDGGELNLVVDRKSEIYQEGTEGGRSGYLGLPFNVDKDHTYAAWVTAAGRPLDAVYRGTETMDGLDTYLYVVELDAAPMGRDDPASGLPLVLDANVITWNDPATGRTVNVDDLVTISAQAPDGTKYVRFIEDLEYTDATVARLLEIAKDDSARLAFYGTTLPWLLIGLGAGLIAVAAVLAGVASLRGSRTEPAA